MVLGKRGSLLDSIFIMFIFVAVLISGLVAFTVLTSFFADPALTAQLQQVGMNNSASNRAGNASITLVQKQTTGGGLDNTVVTFFFMIHLVMLIMAAIIPVSLVFLVINFFFVMLNILISYIVGSLSEPLFAGFVLVSMPHSKWVLDNIIPIELSYAIITVIVMFMANKQATGGG